VDEELVLDGNGVAGLLHDVFAREMTEARACCASCGAIDQLGGARVFVHAPGTVIRCRRCAKVLIVVVQAGGSYRVGLSGLRWLELRNQP
jgi:hypothetical protein